jgi:DNA (cytosine-5)-methyltransferase 1
MGRQDYETETMVAHSLRAEGFGASEDGTGRGTPIVPVAYRTSPNCGAWETGDRVDALTTGTDPTSHVLAFSCKDHGADAQNGIAPTMRAMGHAGSHANAGGQLAVAFDLRGREGGAMPEGPHETANIRAASGGSSRSYVAQTHAIQAGALRENPASGPDGVGVQEGVAYTLEARAEVQAVASQWAVRRLTPTECERLMGFPDGYTQVPYRGKPAADGNRYKALGNSMAVNVMRWIGRRIEMVRAIP